MRILGGGILSILIVLIGLLKNGATGQKFFMEAGTQVDVNKTIYVGPSHETESFYTIKHGLTVTCKAATNDPWHLFNRINVTHKHNSTHGNVVILNREINYTRLNNGTYEYDFSYTNKQPDPPTKTPFAFAGYYDCTFFSNFSSTVPRIYVIAVVCPPIPYGSFRSLKDHSSYYSHALNETADLGSSPWIHCNVHAFPKPNVTWYFVEKPEDDGQLIDAERKSLIPNVTVVNSTSKWRTDGLYLEVKNVQLGDSGYYLCVADNGFGPEMYMFILLRTKNKLAWLWPFFIIIAEVIAIWVISFFCEMHRKKVENDANAQTQKKKN